MVAERNRRAARAERYRYGRQAACDAAGDEQFAQRQFGPVGGNGDPLRKKAFGVQADTMMRMQAAHDLVEERVSVLKYLN
jgi:hypothetical protein